MPSSNWRLPCSFFSKRHQLKQVQVLVQLLVLLLKQVLVLLSGVKLSSLAWGEKRKVVAKAAVLSLL